MLNLAEHLKAMEAAAGGVYQQGLITVEMERSSRVTVANGKQFLFGASWMKADPFPSVLVMRESASLEVRDNFKIFSGAKLFVNKNATLVLGSGYINNGVSIHCFNRIEVGEDVAIADNVTLRDSDNHAVTSNAAHESTSPIRIGNHVWVGMNAIILKGVVIGDGAIIAAGAVVTRSVPPNCLAAGVPARVVKEGVRWE